MNFIKYKIFLEEDELQEFEQEMEEYEADQENLTTLFFELKKGDKTVIETINEYFEFQRERVNKLYQLAKHAYQRFLNLEKQILTLKYRLEEKKRTEFKTERMKMISQEEINKLENEILEKQLLTKLQLEPPVWKYEFHQFIPVMTEDPFEKIKRLEMENARLKNENCIWRHKKYHLELKDDPLENLQLYGSKQLKPMFTYLKMKKKEGELNEDQSRRFQILKAIFNLKNE